MLQPLSEPNFSSLDDLLAALHARVRILEVRNELLSAVLAQLCAAARHSSAHHELAALRALVAASLRSDDELLAVCGSNARKRLDRELPR